MSQPDRKDGIPYQPSFRHLMDELARTTDTATLTRITRTLPSTIRHGEFDPQTVRGIFIETVRTQREENGSQFPNVNALLDVGHILTPHLPPAWATLVIAYQEIRPLVAGVPDNGNDRGLIIDKFEELNKGMLRRIIGEQSETDEFSDKLKASYLASIAPTVELSQSDILTLLFAGQIISPYLPKSPSTLSDIRNTIKGRIDQIELQMSPARAEIYLTSYQKLLHAIEHPETMIPVQKSKSQLVFERPTPPPAEKPRSRRTKSTGRQRTTTPKPRQERPRKPQTEKIEVIIQDDVERLRLAIPGISKEEIAERLSTEVLTIQPYQVRNAITALIAAGRLESNKGFQPNPETATQLARVKALRLGEEYFSDAEIANRLGVDIGRVHVLVDQLLDAGEISPRPHPGKTGLTEATLALRAQIKAIKEGPEDLSQAEIAARVSRSKNYVKKLITEMYASGELQRPGEH